MGFRGPTPGDFANVTALNALFLAALPALAEDGDMPRLSPRAASRLAEAPFLLFSLQEHDSALWQRLLDGGGQLALRDAPATADSRLVELRVAAVGFLWQVARRNPYAARLVSAAPCAWCQDIASRTLVHLVRSVTAADEVITTRFAPSSPAWRRLLKEGVSSSAAMRRFAHLAALQEMLTRGASRTDGRLAAAACRMRDPAGLRRGRKV
ncbi:MAG TPA: hypothetical protein VIS31_03575 [Woeseiaceae bacterium]